MAHTKKNQNPKKSNSTRSTAKELKLDEATALTLYPKADQPFKDMLEKTFGKATFNRKITDRIKTMADVYKELKIKASNVEIKSDLPALKDELSWINAHKNLVLMAQVLNEGWEPNWSDSNEYKYTPYFSLASGFGFSGTYSVCGHAYADVGSRLVFKSRELALYAGKTFLAEYKKYMLLK